MIMIRIKVIIVVKELGVIGMVRCYNLFRSG